MEDAPNARTIGADGEPEYSRVGDNLKIRYQAERGKGWVSFNPANLHIELNGVPLTTCQSVIVKVGPGLIPEATLKMNLESIDIDADTMTALEAFVTKEA